MSQLSLKYLGTTIQRQIQSSISEPFQSAVADIKSLWAAVFGGTGNIVSGTITADNVVTDTISEETTAAGVTVDGALLKDGGVSNVGGTILAGFYPIGAQQALSGPGAVNLTSYFTHFTSTGTGDALTLANGSQKGQLKQITYIAEAAGGDTGVLTLTGYTSITFTTIWDEVVLIWTGAAWIAIGVSGVTIV